MARKGVEISSPSSKKSITLRKVENGYTVSCWDDKTSKEKIYVAYELEEAQGYMDELLK